MRTKDQLLLEEAYQKIYLKENENDHHHGPPWSKFDNRGEFVDSIEYVFKNTPPEKFIDAAIRFYLKPIANSEIFNIKRYIQEIVEELLNLKDISDDEIRIITDRVLSAHKTNSPQEPSISPDYYDTDEDERDENKDSFFDMSKESFVHGIQPIVEAKKKELPLALKKAIEKKTGKKFGKKNKDEPTKGFVKLAKKSGKKITSDKFKAKKK